MQELPEMSSSSNNNSSATARTALTQRPSENCDDAGSVSSYLDPSSNDLTVWPGAALIVADCMGTGILALPNNLKILGGFGFFFLIANLPINYYAGDILHKAANYVEFRLDGKDETPVEKDDYKSVSTSIRSALSGDWNNCDDHPYSDSMRIEKGRMNGQEHHHYGIDTPHTFDFIGITYSLFDHFESQSYTPNDGSDRQRRISKPTWLVTTIYYANIILVLGNYILVMSHAVAAMIGEDRICLPTAGILASTLMFAISQLRTMATLGRTASVISLLSLAVVVLQCLIAIQMGHESFSYKDKNDIVDYDNLTFWQSMISQFSALSSIGFAVGSQKLFLNIRHEFSNRNQSPKSLAIALFSFGTIYVLVCILASSNPPSFLFDAVPSGLQRRFAGFFLWVHVAVSFAINSQALCSSLDRLKFHRVTIFGLGESHRARWAVLTFLVATSSYFIANAIPFFEDLVALIGAVTSVPLTLLLPALYHRKVIEVPMFWVGTGTLNDFSSLSLVIFSSIFLVLGVFGSISSIQMDWSNHGSPFSCH
mmetsp:Transcript_15247/g.28704  ORF Transcript_15247/g.28704 Transcript_15247/m.28704 type:complete len:539 (-) Transcript_15247:58-1674(-)